MPAKSKYKKEAENQKCAFTLKEVQSLKRNHPFITDKTLVSPDNVADLIMWSPSKESNLGVKFSKKIHNHIDNIVDDLLAGLDIKNYYFFSSYTSENEKKDLKSNILSDSKPFIALYCSSAFLESIYTTIRNALAHGNIIKSDQFYYLYAVSPKEDKKTPDEDRYVTFLLKIHDLKKLSTYMEVFNKYNGEQ